jgi:monofunctional biosynthetic peptidoglycan transglycosylase
VRAVVAAEDMRFCDHWGFDWGEIKDAAARNRKGQRVRGASTITMQTAKNLFLWPARSWLRKGFEAYLTVWIEVLWPKARVIEVYLNIVEWGPGIYGAEAAARYWFDISARSLSPHQAALLAASLPSPLYSTPAWPSDYLWSRAATILSRMGDTHLDRVTVCP